MDCLQNPETHPQQETEFWFAALQKLKDRDLSRLHAGQSNSNRYAVNSWRWDYQKTREHDCL